MQELLTSLPCEADSPLNVRHHVTFHVNKTGFFNLNKGQVAILPLPSSQSEPRPRFKSELNFV